MAPPKGPTAGKPETRALLIAHAVRLVEEVGLAQFTAREVARRVGVSPAAPFRHFPSRSALLSDAAASGFRDLRDRMLAEVRRSTTEQQRVVRLGMEYVAFAQERPAIFDLMFRNDLASSAGEPVFEQRLSVLNLMINGATGGDDLSVTPTGASLVAGVHGLAVLASQGFMEPLPPERLQAVVERHVAAHVEQQC